MKKLGPKGIKWLKILHLLLIMMLTTGVIAMAALFLIKPQTGDEQYMLLSAILYIDDYFVVIGALLSVVVGTFYFHPNLLQALEITDQTRDAALSNPVVISHIRQAMILAFLQGGSLVILVAISVLKPWKKKNI